MVAITIVAIMLKKRKIKHEQQMRQAIEEVFANEEAMYKELEK